MIATRKRGLSPISRSNAHNRRRQQPFGYGGFLNEAARSPRTRHSHGMWRHPARGKPQPDASSVAPTRHHAERASGVPHGGRGRLRLAGHHPEPSGVYSWDGRECVGVIRLLQHRFHAQRIRVRRRRDLPSMPFPSGASPMTARRRSPSPGMMGSTDGSTLDGRSGSSTSRGRRSPSASRRDPGTSRADLADAHAIIDRCVRPAGQRPRLQAGLHAHDERLGLRIGGGALARSWSSPLAQPA